MSIRNKIILSLVATICLTVAGSAVIVFWQSRSSVNADFGANASIQVRLMNDYMALLMKNASAVTQTIAELPAVVEAEGKVTSYVATTSDTPTKMKELPQAEQIIGQRFASYGNVFPAYELIYLGTEDGGFLQYPDDTLTAGYDPRTRVWYKEAKAAGRKTILTDPYLSDNGSLVYTIARAVHDAQGRFFGVVGIDINLKELTQFLDSVSVGKTGNIILAESSGLILYDPADKSRVLKNVREVGNPSLLNVFNMGKGAGEAEFGGQPYAAVADTTDEGWHLMMFITRSELLSDAVNIVVHMLQVGVVLAVILALAGVALSRSIVAPINRLVDAAQGVAGGDFNAVPRDYPFRGELQKLHASMVSMVDQLAALIATARGKTEEAENALRQSHQALQQAEEAKRQAELARREGVAQTADQLGGVVGALGDASRQLGEQAHMVTEAVDAQLGRTTETSTAMHEMNATVSEVARNAAEASRLAEQAKQESMSGRRSVDDVVASISKVEEYTAHMNTSMEQLVRQADDIGQIMNIITDIADQTNLLALNAAIEAARAGDAGRGFAVVADEVRKLAEKTMEATKSVGQAIRTIQQGAESNNQLIRQSSEQVRASTELAGTAGRALERIEDMVLSTADQVRMIAAASEEQASTSEEVTRHTQDVNRIAGEVAQAMVQANKGTQALNQLTDELQRIIRSLKQAS